MPSTAYTDVTQGVRALGARTNFAGTGVTDVSAEEDRYPAITYSQGVLKPVASYLPVKGAAATMNVIIGSGTAKTDYYVVEGVASGMGNYIVRLEGATQTMTLSNAGAQDRIDEIYLVVRDDAYDSSGRAIASLAIRQGDEAASPVAPGPDGAWDAYALLVTIDVPSTAVDIDDTTLTDGRETSVFDTAGGGVNPPGGIIAYAGSAAPIGWFLCDGQAVSRTTYAALFGITGTTYGVGDGSTTFNVPDLRQRFPLGKAASGTGNALGDSGGAIDHVHTNPDVDSAGAHTHSVDPPNTTSTTDGAHTHDVNIGSFTSGSGGSHTHTLDNAGAFSITDGAQNRGNIDTNEANNVTSSHGGHTHSIDPPNTASTSSGSHDHDVNIASFLSASDGAHQHTQGDTGANNPPYLVVNYIIKAA